MDKEKMRFRSSRQGQKQIKRAKDGVDNREASSELQDDGRLRYPTVPNILSQAGQNPSFPILLGSPFIEHDALAIHPSRG